MLYDTGRSSTRALVLRDRGAREGRHDDDGRRRLRRTAGRGTATRLSYDLSSLFAIGTGGAATNPKHQRALLELLPQITLINGYGSSETGNMGFGHSQRGIARRTPSSFARAALVLSEDYSRFLQPGEQEVGWVARAGRIPLGYFDDRGRHPQDVSRSSRGSGWSSPATGLTRRPTARCACSAAIRWWSTPAARRCSSRRSRRCCARTPPSPTLWWWAGRASAGVRNSSLWWHCADGADADRRTTARPCTSHLARFKAPKEFIFVEQVHRLGNGKADYRWAKSKLQCNRRH